MQTDAHMDVRCSLPPSRPPSRPPSLPFLNPSLPPSLLRFPQFLFEWDDILFKMWGLTRNEHAVLSTYVPRVEERGLNVNERWEVGRPGGRQGGRGRAWHCFLASGPVILNGSFQLFFSSTPSSLPPSLPLPSLPPSLHASSGPPHLSGILHARGTHGPQRAGQIRYDAHAVRAGGRPGGRAGGRAEGKAGMAQGAEALALACVTRSKKPIH